MSLETQKSEEFKIVGLLALGFGLVGIDRFLISTMFPVIARDLNLDYADIGRIAGALALAWGVAALLMGNIADQIGRRTVLVGSLVVFSVLIGASGLATGLAGLIAIRMLMGLADGAYTPASIAATIDASAPKRQGLNVGIQQTMLPLFGLGLSPLIVAALLDVIDWRWVFLVFTLPGLLVAWLVWRTLPAKAVDSNPADHAHVNGAFKVSLADWKQVLAFRNMWIAMAMMACWLTCLITTSALLPSYLTDHLGLPLPTMGYVMSAIGIGAMAGTLALPALSDRVGRKPVMILSTVGGLVAVAMLMRTGANPIELFAWLGLVHFFNNALITITVGPLCSETVPRTLLATASGLVIASGELLGGCLAPVVAGEVAQRLGIASILWMSVGALALGLLLCLAIQTRSTGEAHA